jgi:release factor glutamine methyltransferase
MTSDDLITDAAKRLERAGIESARLDAQLLMCFALGCRREDLARDPSREIDDLPAAHFADAVVRRERRSPLPYIVGTCEFYGRTFDVSPAVLIPRPETEILVARTLGRVAKVDKPKIADIGTGGGCLAITLARERPDARVHAVDIDAGAIEIACSNAKRHEVASRVRFWVGDLLEPLLSDGPFDIVVSNPPYVAEGLIAELQPEVRDYEPRIALTGTGTGPDGADVYRRLIPQAVRALKPGGWVLLEVGMGQGAIVQAIAASAGLVDILTTPDYGGIDRVVEGRKA